MMTSTFPTTRSNGNNLKYGIRELQHKKEVLLNLEAALKKRINEFRQLCLKEGELTGHLPADYPLQPREPIPQVRRRVTRSNSNIPSELHTSLSSGSLMPPPPTVSVHPSSLTSLNKNDLNSLNPATNFALPPNARILTHPSRPTSTTSSASTASSSLNKHTLDSHVARITNYHPTTMTTNRMHSSDREINRINNYRDDINRLARNDSHNYNNQPTEHTAAIMLQRRQKELQQQRQQQQQQQKLTRHCDQPFVLRDHFKKPFTIGDSANPNFDTDSLGHVRASSMASSSSSSGSAASSTVSAFAAIPSQSSQHYVDSNLHFRSCSENVPVNGHPLTGRPNGPLLASSQTNFNSNHSDQLAQHPVRPPRGTHNLPGLACGVEQPKVPAKNPDSNLGGLANSAAPRTEGERQIENDTRAPQNVAKFQSYYEETKPFQMSDFYKYSAKHRQQAASQGHAADEVKTTRQLQAEIASMKNPLKLTDCDDQIQASRKLIEQSGQKFINATAKAIACNPSLAERLNGIMPNQRGQGYQVRD